MSGQTLVSKYFETLGEAVMFSIYQVTTGNVYSIDKVEE
jgi:predicted Fe-Mo cluster-binding NifX family protein